MLTARSTLEASEMMPTGKINFRHFKIQWIMMKSFRYDLEDAFTKYGPVRNVWVARRPPGFAFVEMEDPRDAEDAVRGIDGTRVCGSR